MTEPIAYLKQRILGADPSLVVALGDDDSPVLTPLGGDLLVSYLIEQGDQFTYVQGRDLAKFGGSSRTLHERAVGNLARMSEGRITTREAGSIQALFLDGIFEASLLLMDDLWDERLRPYFTSAPLVAVPSRDVLAFGDRSSAAATEELRAVIDRVWPHGDHLLSRTLYVRDNGRWLPFGE